MKYKTIEEINKNPVWIKLQSNGTDKEQLDKQFLSLTEVEKIVAIDLFESLKVVMENVLKEKKPIIYTENIPGKNHSLILLITAFIMSFVLLILKFLEVKSFK